MSSKCRGSGVNGRMIERGVMLIKGIETLRGRWRPFMFSLEMGCLHTSNFRCSPLSLLEDHQGYVGVIGSEVELAR